MTVQNGPAMVVCFAITLTPVKNLNTQSLLCCKLQETAFFDACIMGHYEDNHLGYRYTHFYVRIHILDIGIHTSAWGYASWISVYTLLCWDTLLGYWYTHYCGRIHILDIGIHTSLWGYASWISVYTSWISIHTPVSGYRSWISVYTLLCQDTHLGYQYTHSYVKIHILDISIHTPVSGYTSWILIYTPLCEDMHLGYQYTHCCVRAQVPCAMIVQTQLAAQL